jgi:surface antigen
MIRKISSSMMALTLILAMAGCETAREHRGATTGAAVGAAAGAIAGGAAGERGRKTETAIVGALIGSVIGGVIGHYTYDRKQDRDETARRYDYNDNQGNVVRIESLQADPTVVRRGQTVDITMTYAILTPSRGQDLTVTETREVRRNGTLIGKPEIVVTRSSGTYSSTVPITLEGDARPGTYTIMATVSAGGSSMSRESTFRVE